MSKAPKYTEGDQVEVRGYDFTMRGVVVDRTRGDATKIRLADGRTMLIANRIIRKTEQGRITVGGALLTLITFAMIGFVISLGMI